MARATPSAAAHTGSATKLAQVMPAKAETVLPPTIAHGCAMGLAGAANSKTALAPIGATSHVAESAGSLSQREISAVRPMPNAAPTNARQRSF